MISTTPSRFRRPSLYFGPFDNKRVAAFHINRRKKNLFFTLTDLTGSVLGSVSAKTFMANRKKRFALHIIELLVRKLALLLKAYRIYSVRLFVKFAMPTPLRHTMRAFKSYGVKFTSIVDLVPVAHNGCRHKKRRRL